LIKTNEKWPSNLFYGYPYCVINSGQPWGVFRNNFKDTYPGIWTNNQKYNMVLSQWLTHCAIGIRQYVMNFSTDDENQWEVAVEFILRVSLLCYKFGTALRQFSKWFSKCRSRDLKHERKTIIYFVICRSIHRAMRHFRKWTFMTYV
jgi:hypothetical protein